MSHRNYDGLRVKFGRVEVDVPTEMERYSEVKGEEEDAMVVGRCRYVVGVGASCWFPIDGGV